MTGWGSVMEMPKHIEAILNGKVVIGGVELDLDDVRAIYYKMLGHELPGTTIREELSHVCEFVDVNYPEDTLKAEIWLGT